MEHPAPGLPLVRPGVKLPSISQLQAQYEVSYGPVRTAMLILKAEGLVRGVPGEGVYVTESDG